MIVAGKYDAELLAKVILGKYEGIRKSVEYLQEQDRIIDETMSCDKGEQVAWMKHYMNEAVHMDKSAEILRGEKSLEQFRYEVAVQYLVAYDLL